MHGLVVSERLQEVGGVVEVGGGEVQVALLEAPACAPIPRPYHVHVVEQPAPLGGDECVVAPGFALAKGGGVGNESGYSLGGGIVEDEGWGMRGIL